MRVTNEDAHAIAYNPRTDTEADLAADLLDARAEADELRKVLTTLREAGESFIAECYSTGYGPNTDFKLVAALRAAREANEK